MAGKDTEPPGGSLSAGESEVLSCSQPPERSNGPCRSGFLGSQSPPSLLAFPFSVTWNESRLLPERDVRGETEAALWAPSYLLTAAPAIRCGCLRAASAVPGPAAGLHGAGVTQRLPAAALWGRCSAPAAGEGRKVRGTFADLCRRECLKTKCDVAVLVVHFSW